jgi:hypothetical protein
MDNFYFKSAANNRFKLLEPEKLAIINFAINFGIILVYCFLTFHFNHFVHYLIATICASIIIQSVGSFIGLIIAICAKYVFKNRKIEIAYTTVFISTGLSIMIMPWLILVKITRW